VSRATSLDSIYVFFDPNINRNRQIVQNLIQRKIDAHKLEDFKKKREYDEENYVDLRFVLGTYKSQGGKCKRCEHEIILDYNPKDELQYSINRIDNKLAHIKSNCELTCLTCQHSYR
jgi:hypothetical protein